MRILVIGSGGREHALLKGLSGNELVVAPGNAGMSTLAKQLPIDATSPQAIVALARDEQAELVVIGPEAPLVTGAADALRKAGIPVFGPSPVAAQMEGSKTFAKAFMDKYNIPTAAFQSFDASQVDECLAYIQKLGELKSKGVDVVAVIASNDSWVMNAWGKVNGVKGDDILFLSDTKTFFSKNYGWAAGMGDRK